MNFKELLYRARQGDEDDLYQELTAELLKCIRYFRDVD